MHTLQVQFILFVSKVGSMLFILFSYVEISEQTGRMFDILLVQMVSNGANATSGLPLHSINLVSCQGVTKI